MLNIIRKLQIKITMRCYYKVTKIAKIKVSIKEDVKELEFSYMADRNIKYFSHFYRSFVVS